MPSIEEVLQEWKKDSIINDTKLDKEILRSPQLHSKYLDYFVFFKAKLAAAEKNHNKMMWVKRKYFRGECDQQDLQKYGWSQWQGLKPSSTELNQLLEMDSDMNSLAEAVTLWKTSVNAIEYIMKQIQGRDWSIKSIIEYQKYIAGN